MTHLDVKASVKCFGAQIFGAIMANKILIENFPRKIRIDVNGRSDSL